MMPRTVVARSLAVYQRLRLSLRTWQMHLQNIRNTALVKLRKFIHPALTKALVACSPMPPAPVSCQPCKCLTESMMILTTCNDHGFARHIVEVWLNGAVHNLPLIFRILWRHFGCGFGLRYNGWGLEMSIIYLWRYLLWISNYFTCLQY